MEVCFWECYSGNIPGLWIIWNLNSVCANFGIENIIFIIFDD